MPRIFNFFNYLFCLLKFADCYFVMLRKSIQHLNAWLKVTFCYLHISKKENRSKPLFYFVCLVTGEEISEIQHPLTTDSYLHSSLQ